MVEKRKDLVKMGGTPMTLLGKEAVVGEKGPDFTALTTEMEEYSLYKDGKDKIKIISVVPSLDTPVCELQTITFNEKAAELGDVAILTLSVDLPFAQKRFCGAQGIDKVITLSDHKDLDFGLNYGFVMEENRLLARGIVVLDKDNTIKYVEYVEDAGEHPDYDKALEAVEELV